MVKIAERCQHHGVFAGIHVGSAEYALYAQELGYQFTTLLSDAALLGGSAQDIVTEVKDGKASPGGKRDLY